MILYWLIQLSQLAFAEDGGVNLSDLGMDDFTPYLVDRNPLWALAPVAMLLFVVLHLKKQKQPSTPTEDEGIRNEQKDV